MGRFCCLLETRRTMLRDRVLVGITLLLPTASYCGIIYRPIWTLKGLSESVRYGIAFISPMCRIPCLRSGEDYEQRSKLKPATHIARFC